MRSLLHRSRKVARCPGTTDWDAHGSESDAASLIAAGQGVKWPLAAMLRTRAHVHRRWWQRDVASTWFEQTLNTGTCDWSPNTALDVRQGGRGFKVWLWWAFRNFEKPQVFHPNTEIIIKRGFSAGGGEPFLRRVTLKILLLPGAAYITFICALKSF